MINPESPGQRDGVLGSLKCMVYACSLLPSQAFGASKEFIGGGNRHSFRRKDRRLWHFGVLVHRCRQCLNACFALVESYLIKCLCGSLERNSS